VTAQAASPAEELYGLPAAEFTAARDRMAVERRRAGETAVAAAIKKLRRPMASAWSVNQLARVDSERVAELLDIGEEMRTAQARLDGEQLRRLSQDGQRIIAELGRHARRIAGEADQPLSEEGGREVDETLRAALADPEAGEAVRSGCLVRALRYSGFGPVDLTGVAAGPAPVSPVGPSSSGVVASQPAGRPAGGRPAGGRPAGGRARLLAATQALRDAELDQEGARRHLDHQRRQFEVARGRLDDLRRRVARARQQLEELEADEAHGARRSDDEEQALHEATRALEAAESRLTQARQVHDAAEQQA
jgi:hypothetical protein